MNYTREQINRLICQYQPAILYRERVYRLSHPPLYSDTVLKLETIPFEHISAPLDECRMMLRPVGGLTEQELVDLWKLLKEPVEIALEDGDYYIVGTSSYRGCTYLIGDKLPLHIADYLFSKHINFLNLPSEICTEQITTNGQK